MTTKTEQKKDEAVEQAADATPDKPEGRMVAARLLPLGDRRVDVQRQRLEGTKSFTRVEGKATDPPEHFVASAGSPSPQQVGMKAMGRYRIDTEWREVPMSMVATLREEGQIVQVQCGQEGCERICAEGKMICAECEELLEAGVIQ